MIKGGKNGVNYAEYDFSRLNGYKKKILMMFSRHFVLILLGNLLDCNLQICWEGLSFDSLMTKLPLVRAVNLFCPNASAKGRILSMNNLGKAKQSYVFF